MILLQVDPAFGDEPETICEGCYEPKDTFIFMVFGSQRGLIHHLLPNSKANYLVRTI